MRRSQEEHGGGRERRVVREDRTRDKQRPLLRLMAACVMQPSDRLPCAHDDH